MFSRAILRSASAFRLAPLASRGAQLSTAAQPRLVLSPEECDRLVRDGRDVVPIDVSWHMPAAGRDGRREHEKARLPKARFLDLDAVATTGHALNLPHMMPSASLFAQTCGGWSASLKVTS